MITKDYLKNLSPCEDRYKHYLKHYKDFEGTLEEFLDLPELTHEDKIWVFVRSLDKDKLRLVAADFAERVLHIFENKYPNDDRPRKAIEAARRNDKDAADATYAARAAAYADAAAVNAVYAAYAAYADAADVDAYAAVSAARAAANAARAADAYAAVSAARAAARAAAYAADAREAEEMAQLQIMKRYAREALKEIE
jgi:hypothetical protein